MSHVPASLAQLMAEMRLTKTSIPASSPSLSALVAMEPDDRKHAIAGLGLKKVSQKSRLRKRIEQIEKNLSDNPEKAYAFYSKAVEDSKGADYAALLRLAVCCEDGIGAEKNHKRAVQFEIEAKCAPGYAERQARMLEAALEAKTSEIASWRIHIHFQNEKGEGVRTLALDEERKIPEKTLVRHVIDSRVMPVLKELKWEDYFLWCKHEKITAQTEFQDLSYQRTSDGKVDIYCLNSTNKPKLAKETTSAEYVECAVCLDEDEPLLALLACKHACCCAECWKTVDKCPICNKRKPVDESEDAAIVGMLK